MDRIEAVIPQHLYCPGIINAVRKEVTNCYTCQRKKQSNKNMVNYQLRKLRKYYGKTLCRYNGYLCPNNKGTEIKLKSKIRYYDRACNRMVKNNVI